MKRAALFLGATLACALAWRADPRGFLACYLAAWWFGAGALLGGLANVWLHNLTGGAWGEAVRPPLLRAARAIPAACLLFLPVLAGVAQLYPWADPAAAARLHAELGAPRFKQWWLQPGFFVARSAVYLLLWGGAAWLTARPALQRSRAWSAACLVTYMFSVWLASVDWIMSLQPQWYSSVFGWLAGTGQMLAGLALAVVLARRDALRPVLPDLGNLLLMYVMTWAYLAYVQFLIIWAANLPHEIVWYTARRAMPWPALAWVLVGLHCVAPVLLLLSRQAKRAPMPMVALASMLLAVHLLYCWWLVLPSVAPGADAWWLAPLAAAALLLPAWSWRAREVSHA
jgi:hypothetical protein